MKGWVKRKIIDFCYVTDFVANGSFASLRENVTYLNSPDYAILVRLTDFTKKWSKGFVYVSKESYDFLRKSSLLPDDLIMSNVGEPGIVFLVPDLGKPMTLGPNSILIRPNEELSTSKFIHLYFLSEKGKKQIDDISTGAAQKKFNKTSFRDLEISLPPLPEQQRIVAILDEAFAAIAKAKANAEQNLINAKELFESYLQGVFEKKGEGWEEKKLGEVYSFKNGINFDKTQKNGKGILTLDVLNMYCEGLKVDISKLYRIDKKVKEDCILKNEDILIVRSSVKEEGVAWATYFEEGDEQITYCGFIIRGRPFEKLNAKYVVYFLRTEGVRSELIKKATKSTITNINQSNLSEIIIPIPPINEQQTIVRQLDALRVETQRLEAVYQQKLSDLEELKKSILQKAFAGELTDKSIAS